MSRDWNQHKYCSAENLWSWVDDQAIQIETRLESYKNLGGDGYKLLLMGRKEMLDTICDWLHENETTLGDVAKVWGLGVKDE